MSLDISKLPEKTTPEKAIFWRGDEGFLFGTLYVCPQADGMLVRKEFTETHKDVTSTVMAHGEGLTLPKGWEVDTMWYDDEYRVANWVSYTIRVRHQLRQLQRGGGIPKEVGYLVAGNLQLGEAFNFRNFRNYVYGQDLKYLPFVIGPEHFRFNIFNPTPERVQKGLEDFKTLLDKLEGLIFFLPEVLADVYAVVRLDEVKNASPLIPHAKSEVELRLKDSLQPYSKEFGYLYKDLPGPQDVKVFDYDMFAAKK